MITTTADRYRTEDWRGLDPDDADDVVAALRQRMAISPVRRGEIPAWLRDAVKAAYGVRHDDETGMAMLCYVLRPSGLYDHAGSATLADGREAYVLEPYRHAMSQEAVDAVNEVAERIGCEVTFDTRSWHTPGHTVRIAFVRLDSNSLTGAKR